MTAPRPATAADLPVLRDVERAAGEAFRALGMDAIADDEPPPLEVLEAYRRDGRAWVTGDPPVGYLLLDVVDGAAHVEQVSVHPAHARRGLGRALVEEADRWAAARGLPALTLTTFAGVPWNAPYYERLGFRVVTDPGPGLRAVREHEAAIGLDRWPRVAMRRTVAACSARRTSDT